MSTRFDQFYSDVNKSVSLSAQYEWPFTDFVQNETTLTFTCHRADGSHKYSLCISPDEYPQNTVLTVHAAMETTSIIHKCVPVFLLQLRDELLCLDNRSSQKTSSISAVSNYLDCESGDDDDDDEEDDEYFVQDLLDEDEELDESEEINPQLTEDMDQVHLLFGDSALSYRLFEPIGEIDVELNIPVTFLYADVAEAWDLDLTQPLTVRLHLSSVHYRCLKDPPKLEVFQATKKETFQLGSQLKKILENFLSENWNKLNNKEQQTASKSVSVPAELSSFASNSEYSQAGEPSVDDEDLAHMVEMGFSLEVSRNALIVTQGNVEQALNLVMNQTDSYTQLDSVSETAGSTRKSQAPAHRNRKGMKSGYKQWSVLSAAATNSRPEVSGTSSAVDSLSLMSSLTLSGSKAKDLPSLENGFLVQIFRYTHQRIPTLNEYCVVCDEPHLFQNAAMLKPAVCSRDLCVFAFQTLGVMVDAADDVATTAEVVVLLMKMTMAACKSSRKALIFDPYPMIVDPDNPQKLALNPKKKNFPEIASVMKQFPNIEDMLRFSSSQLKREMDRRHCLLYPLLQWIISSNRSHIVKLPADRQITCMTTPHQFLLLSSPPAKEAEFQTEKRKYGSTYAFHGSNIENWHSIIRRGLMVASGTIMQMHGAACGKGIYLSPLLMVSAGYSRIGYGVYHTKSKTNNRFLTSDKITCIALCEVITSPDLKKHNDIWVCSKDSHVCTRFFFVYEDGCLGDNSMDTQIDIYKREILKAVSYQNYRVK